MRLLIFGVPRSGTTMLASMLNNPPEFPVLSEPRGLVQATAPDERSLDFLAQLGIRPESWPDAISRLDQVAKAWGVKVVQGGDLRAIVSHAAVRPERIVVVLRDIRHCAVSYRERLKSAGLLGELERRMNWIAVSAQTVLWLNARCLANPDWRERTLFVRYDEVVHSMDARSRIGAWTGFPIGGDVDFHLRQDPRTGGRHGEADLHGGRITAQSLEESARRLVDPDNSALAARMHSRCEEFQQTFGFAGDEQAPVGGAQN